MKRPMPMPGHGRFPHLLLTACLGFAACGQDPAASRPGPAPAATGPTSAPASALVAGYELGRALRAFSLPPELREVSGITATGPDTVACVQDEHGAIFQFDLVTGRVTGHQRFGPAGDYEGLTLVGDEYWVLRSDGTLLRVVRDGRGLATADRHVLVSAHRNWEGVAFDRAESRLLLVPKDVPKGSDKEERDERLVFGFDLKTRRLGPEPLLTLRVKDLAAQARRLGFEVPTKLTGKGLERTDLKLRVAEVAVHPETGEFWLLSALDRILLVVDRGGRLRALHQFAESELPKPEALTFLPDGRLAIASEGETGPAVLRLYGKKP